MIRAYDYYRNGEWVAEKLSEVKATIEVVNTYAEEHGAKVFWRGQANHTWPLSSSLVRRLSGLADVDDELLARVESSILDESAAWVKDLAEPQYAKPLAKLAYLQHHGVPTRLLDFSSNPWMGVFFAAERDDEVDGRVFALIVAQDAILAETPEATPWRDYATDEVRIYDPASHGIEFPRLVAQDGVFAVGRLPSTTPFREALDPELNDKKRPLLAEEVRRILSIPFALSPLKAPGEANRIPAEAVLPVGLTFRLHVNKGSVRRDVSGTAGNRSSPAGTSITHKSAYPDVAGMVANSKTLLGLDKGLLVI